MVTGRVDTPERITSVTEGTAVASYRFETELRVLASRERVWEHLDDPPALRSPPSSSSTDRSHRQRPGHAGGTVLRHTWSVATTKRWMNALAPIARPVFTWNHDMVMRGLAQGLAATLGGPLVSFSSRTTRLGGR